MFASWPAEVPSAIVRASDSGGTAAASSGSIAGLPSDSAVPIRAAITYSGQTAWSPDAASTARARATTAAADRPSPPTQRRSRRSATWPAGSASSTAGTNSARPSSPSTIGWWARAYACHPRAVTTAPWETLTSRSTEISSATARSRSNCPAVMLAPPILRSIPRAGGTGEGCAHSARSAGRRHRHPLEPAQRDHKAHGGPEGERAEVAPDDPRPVDGRIVGVMQPVGEVLHRKGLRDVLEPARQADVRDEHAGVEV